MSTNGVSSVNVTSATTDVQKTNKNSESITKNNTVAMSAQPQTYGKGTSVESGNPYFKKLPDEHFMDLKPS